MEIFGNNITYLHQEETHDEGTALAVAHLPVVDAVGLHHVEERLLAHAVLLLEEFMLWICPGNISSDDLRKYQIFSKKSQLLTGL